MKLIRFTVGFNPKSKAERAIMDSLVRKMWADSRRRGWGCEIYAVVNGDEWFLCRSINLQRDIKEKNYCANYMEGTNCTDRVTNRLAHKVNALELGIIDDYDESALRIPRLKKGKVDYRGSMEQ